MEFRLLFLPFLIHIKIFSLCQQLSSCVTSVISFLYILFGYVSFIARWFWVPTSWCDGIWYDILYGLTLKFLPIYCNFVPDHNPVQGHTRHIHHIIWLPDKKAVNSASFAWFLSLYIKISDSIECTCGTGHECPYCLTRHALLDVRTLWYASPFPMFCLTFLPAPFALAEHIHYV
jgi:hypothetical protein